jgi:hypothetical protein
MSCSFVIRGDDSGHPGPPLVSRASSIEEEVGHFPPPEGPDRHAVLYLAEVHLARRVWRRNATNQAALDRLARLARRPPLPVEQTFFP